MPIGEEAGRALAHLIGALSVTQEEKWVQEFLFKPFADKFKYEQGEETINENPHFTEAWGNYVDFWRRFPQEDAPRLKKPAQIFKEIDETKLLPHYLALLTQEEVDGVLAVAHKDAPNAMAVAQRSLDNLQTAHSQRNFRRGFQEEFLRRIDERLSPDASPAPLRSGTALQAPERRERKGSSGTKRRPAAEA